MKEKGLPRRFRQRIESIPIGLVDKMDIVFRQALILEGFSGQVRSEPVFGIFEICTDGLSAAQFIQASVLGGGIQIRQKGIVGDNASTDFIYLDEDVLGDVFAHEFIIKIYVGEVLDLVKIIKVELLELLFDIVRTQICKLL